MKYPKSILRGYDRVTKKYVAAALGITLTDKRKGGEHKRMKIPMSALKKDKGYGKDGNYGDGDNGLKFAKPKKQSVGAKFGLVKNSAKSKRKNDKDTDDNYNAK